MSAAIERNSVVEMFAEVVRRHPQRLALVADGERLDYAAYGRAVAAVGSLLAAAGAGEGRRVATVLGNSGTACIASFAILASGAQHVPLNPLYTERELRYILEDARPLLIVADDCELPRLAELLPGARLFGAGMLREHIAAWDGDWQVPAVDGAQPALLQYTGGTTGYPKGVQLSHRAIATNVEQREAVLPTRSGEERILCVMPLFHSYAMAMGLFLAVRAAGCLVVLPRYRPEAVMQAVEAEGITIFPGSPTLFTGLMGHADFERTDWRTVHTCYSGSAPLPEAVLRRWESAVGAPIYEGYGQTEAGPILTYNGPQAGTRIASVGRPLPATEIEVVDVETGTAVLPPGQCGEIRARGPQLMSGYLGLPEATADALRGGWLYTGDIGEFDDEGFLFIRDRKKDLVIVGGYNVYPREIDEVLHLHPAVAEAAAVGVPDDYRGEVIHAFVVPRAGATVGVEELLAHCSGNLARYKVPSALALVDALPRTAANKIDKKRLREGWTP